MSTSNRNITVKGNELVLDMMSNDVAVLFVNSPTIVIDGVVYDQKDLAKKLSQLDTPLKELRAARAVFDQKLLDVKAGKAELARFVRSARTAARGALGEDNPNLAKLGFKPLKPRAHKKPKAPVSTPTQSPNDGKKVA